MLFPALMTTFRQLLLPGKEPPNSMLERPAGEGFQAIGAGIHMLVALGWEGWRGVVFLGG